MKPCPCISSPFPTETLPRRSCCASPIAKTARCASAPWPILSCLSAEVIEGLKVISPGSKLATHRLLHDDTANSSLGRVLGVGHCSADDLYAALDWLHEAQPLIERRLARQHLVGSTLVLYDLTSTWLTGRCCELAARG